jgi:glutathione reductase (NADPH)
MKYDYDLFVIGAGSGGVRAARIASLSGARVAIAEEYRIGGTCVIRGCVPKKLLVYGAEFAQNFADAKGFGWTVGNAAFDWATLRDNVQKEVTRLSGIYTSNLHKAGVTPFEERAELVDAHTLKLVKSGSEIRAERILIATGGAPQLLDGLPGLKHGITSNEAFLLEKFPERILIVGGGYVALEFANIFHGLGAKTRIVHRGDRMLRGFDDDLRAHLHIETERAGVQLTMKTTLTKIEKTGGVLRVTLSTGEHVEADQVLFAIGRHPNTGGLGLERGGVQLDKSGAVVVDEYSQSSVESIYAIGDVDQPREPHAGGDSRWPRIRRHRLQQAPHVRGSSQRAQRRVRPPAHRHCRASAKATHATATARSTSTARISVPCATCCSATRSARS